MRLNDNVTPFFNKALEKHLKNYFNSLENNNEILLYHKKGNKIHIKKENRGRFAEYCGGKVTEECINKAKKSGNPKLIKRAVFAQNSRKWKKN